MSELSAETRALLAREGLAPRKHLGQHFLVDPRVVTRMVDLAAVGAGDAVLEIGPGLGTLTDVLAARVARLYLVEYDRGLCGVLRRKFAARPGVHVLEGDALRMNITGAIPERPLKVVASLPYNVAVPIVFRLLDAPDVFRELTVMMQRELAQRLVAGPGTKAYGAPSVLFQLHAELRARFRVSASAFYPRPQVTSEVLRVAVTPEPRVAVADRALFTAIVRAAFGQRRKMLHNALQGVGSALDWTAVLADAGLDGRARGETLDLAAFGALANAAAAHAAARGASAGSGSR